MVANPSQHADINKRTMKILNHNKLGFTYKNTGVLISLLTLAISVHADVAAIYQVLRRPVATSIPVDGVIEATRQASIAAQVFGQVLDVRVETGQAVKKGDVLMRLDVREASEGAAVADAQFIHAKTTYERTQNLLVRKFVSQAAVDKTKAEFDAAAANRNAAHAVQSHGLITSPLNGWIAQRTANLGDLAIPGTPLVTVYDPSKLRVIVQAPQYRVNALMQAKSAKVEVSDGKDGVQWINAESIHIVPSADAATHATQIRVNLPPNLPALVPGTYARVHFVTGTVDKLSVPAGSVLRRGEVTAVYVMPKDGSNASSKPMLRQVRLGDKLLEGEIEVLAGLADGEHIATDPVRAAMTIKAAK
jgi:RND family efflux transporter MFP subunit